MDNKFCIVEGFSISRPANDYLHASIELITNDSIILNQFMNAGSNNFSGLRVMNEEFKCIWCESPNPITNRHCSQCGAPRGFIIK